MEDILNKFNELVQEMANAVAEAKSTKEAEKLQAEWDIKIDIADKQMQEEIEVFIKLQDDALLEEQKASEDEIKKLEKELKELEEVTKESDLLIKFKSYLEDGLSEKEISKNFKESELIEICSLLGHEVTFKGTKQEKVINIIKSLKN